MLNQSDPYLPIIVYFKNIAIVGSGAAGFTAVYAVRHTISDRLVFLVASGTNGCLYKQGRWTGA